MFQLEIVGRFYLLLLKSKAEYRLNFALEIFINFFSYIVSYLGIWIILERFGSINGWEYYEVNLLYTLNLLTYGAACLFFYIPLRSIEGMVQSGEFDNLFTKPLNPFWHLVIRQNYLGFLSHVILGIIMLVICLRKIGFLGNPYTIILLGSIIVGGSMIQAAVIIVMGTLNIKFVRANAFMDTFIYQIRSFIEYPVSIYPPVIQLIITFIVPYAFVNYYPSLYLCGKLTGTAGILLALGPIVLGTLMFIGAYRFFGWMMNQYTGTGS